jgi:hypothetical protein
LTGPRAAAGSALLLLACGPRSEEAAARACLDDLHAAFVAKDADEVERLLAPGYRDNLGHDRKGARQFLRALHSWAGKIHVGLVSLDVKLDEQGAAFDVLADVIIWRKLQEFRDAVPEHADTVRVTGRLARGEEGWRVASAQIRTRAR